MPSNLFKILVYYLYKGNRNQKIPVSTAMQQRIPHGAQPSVVPPLHKVPGLALALSSDLHLLEVVPLLSLIPGSLLEVARDQGLASLLSLLVLSSLV